MCESNFEQQEREEETADELTDEDALAIEQAADLGDAEFAAGRYSSGKDVFDRIQAKYGVFSAFLKDMPLNV